VISVKKWTGKNRTSQTSSYAPDPQDILFAWQIKSNYGWLDFKIISAQNFTWLTACGCLPAWYSCKTRGRTLSPFYIRKINSPVACTGVCAFWTSDVCAICSLPFLLASVTLVVTKCTVFLLKFSGHSVSMLLWAALFGYHHNYGKCLCWCKTLNRYLWHDRFETVSIYDLKEIG